MDKAKQLEIEAQVTIAQAKCTAYGNAYEKAVEAGLPESTYMKFFSLAREAVIDYSFASAKLYEIKREEVQEEAVAAP
jgi:hypothetical protein